MRWAKSQGAVTGYAHSASGLEIDPQLAARRLLNQHDSNKDGALAADEAALALLPAPLASLDTDGDRRASEEELVAGLEKAAEQLPNLAIPEMNGVGAMEICVSAAEGVCDFISAMDTPRIQEWNCWYHLLNCGMPIKVSGETDFPCMSSTRVGQGRVYVQLGRVERVNFGDWCHGLSKGRSYVSDGFAHALQFTVEERSPGTEDVRLEGPRRVKVRALVAFALETPLGVAHGTLLTSKGRRVAGDTVLLHTPRKEGTIEGGERLVEIVVNGRPVASQKVPADGQPHELTFDVPIERSSWVALRQFPQLHTNPVNVIVANRQIRASRSSARWCAAVIEQLWRNRASAIAPAERPVAKETFDRAIARYRDLAAEALAD
jgi:hypothetical protein